MHAWFSFSLALLTTFLSNYYEIFLGLSWYSEDHPFYKFEISIQREKEKEYKEQLQGNNIVMRSV